MINDGICSSQLGFSQGKKSSAAGKLNLVALMDIFTILVFFLLLNAGDAETLDKAKFITLPNSTAGASPHIEAAIVIAKDEIWLNDEVVVNVSDITNDTKKVIKSLSEALKSFSVQRGELTGYEKSNGQAVTIMGDKLVSFALLERVMATCSAENYRDISLAVNRVVSKNSEINLADSSSKSMTKNLGGG